jgi:hypothetical protein
MSEQGEEVPVRVDWSPIQEMDLALANTFVTQLGLPGGIGPRKLPDGILLYVGRLDPPFFLDDAEAAKVRFIESGSVLPVRPLAKLLISRERAIELMQVLESQTSSSRAEHSVEIHASASR